MEGQNYHQLRRGNGTPVFRLLGLKPARPSGGTRDDREVCRYFEYT